VQAYAYVGTDELLEVRWPTDGPAGFYENNAALPESLPATGQVGVPAKYRSEAENFAG
jgi:hypothetical protein